MRQTESARQVRVPEAHEAHVRQAASLFTGMHAAPTLANAERLVQWLGESPVHVRALDVALTEWGLAQSGHPAGDVRAGAGACAAAGNT